MSNLEDVKKAGAYRFRQILVYNIATKGEEETLAFAKKVISESSFPERFIKVVIDLGIMQGIPSFLKYVFEELKFPPKKVTGILGRKESPLVFLARKNDIETIKMLIKYGIDVNGVSKRGISILHVFAEKGNLEMIQYLFEISNINVNIQDCRGNTPLHFAAQGNHLHVMKYLISKGANINAKNKNGFTPLHTAVWYNANEAVFLLIEMGANINETTEEGLTPLHLAITKRNTPLITFLKLKGGI